MRLKKILKDCEILSQKSFKDYTIKSITHESKQVEKNGMFICIKGNNFDGNDYALEAVKNGAKCLVTEKDLDIKNVCIIKVKDIRTTMSIIAKNFYNRACDNMRLIGVIGTAGKTTTSLIIANILSKTDKNIGVIGTNGIFIGNIKYDNKFTTPDPLELHYIFYQMSLLGVKTVVMEVSAQSIYYHKVYGLKFDKCVFTNISEEHLDFFGSMEKYARCKMDFFQNKNMNECVINVDDFYGRELAYKTQVPSISYGLNSPANSFAVDIENSLCGLKFVANIFDEIIVVKSRLVGEYNVYNLLAAMTICKLLGLTKSEIENAIETMPAIPGRFNVFNVGGAKFIVDFAHTPDSFKKILSFVKSQVQKRLIVLFGCVGYSDEDKRKDVGLIADTFADVIILTTDNRGETPFDEIATDIMKGMTKNKAILIEDREQAINYASSICESGDIVCVLGKGAEDFQKIEKERVPYSDLDIVKKLSKEK